jgi:hypothetical protein
MAAMIVHHRSRSCRANDVYDDLLSSIHGERRRCKSKQLRNKKQRKGKNNKEDDLRVCRPDAKSIKLDQLSFQLSAERMINGELSGQSTHLSVTWINSPSVGLKTAVEKPKRRLIEKDIDIPLSLRGRERVTAVMCTGCRSFTVPFFRHTIFHAD